MLCLNNRFVDSRRNKLGMLRDLTLLCSFDASLNQIHLGFIPFFAETFYREVQCLFVFVNFQRVLLVSNHPLDT